MLFHILCCCVRALVCVCMCLLGEKIFFIQLKRDEVGSGKFYLNLQWTKSQIGLNQICKLSSTSAFCIYIFFLYCESASLFELIVFSVTHLSLFASLFVLGLFLCYTLKIKLQWTLGLSCYLHKAKLINNSKYALYLRFLRVATLFYLQRCKPLAFSQ